MHSHVLRSLCRGFGVAMLAAMPVALVAQDAPKPAATTAFPGESPSRWDIFAGYSYLAPKGTVNVLQPDGVTVLPQTFKSMNYGIMAAAPTTLTSTSAVKWKLRRTTPSSTAHPAMAQPRP